MNTALSSQPGAKTAFGYRWTICALLFAATTINYIDRQILSLLKPLLDADLHWTNEQFGWINSFFQAAYACSYVLFGWVVDRYGVRLGYALSIGLWSLAAAAHALVYSIPGFAAARVALGLGEGGNFPAALKSVAQWFPKKERVLCTTLFNSGANVGAMLAPAVIPWMAITFSWHAPFLAAGIAGFIWLGFWLTLYELPRRSKRVSPEELAFIESDHEQAAVMPALPWRKLFSYRQTWGYLVARAMTDPAWWFFLIWLPDYFKKSRGLDLKAMGAPLVAIYAIVTVLSIAGGWVIRWLSDRGWSTTRIRRASLGFFAICVLPVVFVGHMDIWGAVLLIGLAGAAHQSWSASLYTTVSDLYPRGSVATVVGIGGMVGSFGGMVFPVVCGKILDAFGPAGYAILFGYCGLAYLIAFGINTLLTPRFEPIGQSS